MDTQTGIPLSALMKLRYQTSSLPQRLQTWTSSKDRLSRSRSLFSAWIFKNISHWRPIRLTLQPLPTHKTFYLLCGLQRDIRIPSTVKKIRTTVGGKQHIFHVLRPRRIPTPKRGFDGPNNPPLRHRKPGPCPPYRSEKQIPSWWPSTGQLWPPRSHRVTLKQTNHTTRPGTSIPNTFRHRKPGVQRPIPVTSNRSAPTSSQPFHKSFIRGRLPTTKGVPCKYTATIFLTQKFLTGMSFQQAWQLSTTENSRRFRMSCTGKYWLYMQERRNRGGHNCGRLQ